MKDCTYPVASAAPPVEDAAVARMTEVGMLNILAFSFTRARLATANLGGNTSAAAGRLTGLQACLPDMVQLCESRQEAAVWSEYAVQQAALYEGYIRAEAAGGLLSDAAEYAIGVCGAMGMFGGVTVGG